MNPARLALLIAFACAAHAQPVTFNRDIAPVVYQHCASCHRPGEAGPFSFLTYQDVKKRDVQIAAVTASHYMPPWLPEPGYGDFANSVRLSDADIHAIALWAAAGAPEGDPGDLPPAPHFTEGWQLGTPDLILEAPTPFAVPASGPDLYWNFVFAPKVAATRYVRAIEIRPGDRGLVHHANLLIDRMASSPAAGFPGMEISIMRNPFDPNGHLLFWKPGSLPHEEREGLAWRLDPGDLLVLNTHFHPTGKAEEARPLLGLYFTDHPQTRFPVLVQLENDEALRIPPGARDFVVADDFRLPLDADVLAVYPHAHYLGKLLEAWATLPDGSRKWLIRIPNWDPAWQSVYEYREPVFLPKGSVISMRYHYDNSDANVRNPNHPPKLVEAGNQTTDEMAHLWLQLLPRGSADRRREVQEAMMRHRLEKNPADFTANFNLGAVMLSRLDAQDAVPHLEAAAKIEPRQPETRNMLGLALERVGRVPEAIAEYRIALLIRPDFPSATFNLARVLARSGQRAEAIELLRQLAAAHPEDPLPKQRLEEMLAARP